MGGVKGLLALIIAIFLVGVAYQTFHVLRKGEGSLARRGRGVPTEARGAKLDEPAAVPVRIAPVKRGEVRDIIRQTASLAAVRSTPLFALQPGIIVEILVEEGARVRKGRLLLRLDDRELALNLERASVRLEREREEWSREKEISRQALSERAEYREAKFAYESKRVLLERLGNERQRRESEARRTEVSFQEQLASEKERDDARFALDQARFEEEQTRIEFRRAKEEWERVKALDARSLIDEEAYSQAKFGFQEAQADYRLARLKLSQARVEAPQESVVVAIDVREGDYVSSNTRLMTLEDLGRLEAELFLPELQWSVVRPGQPVLVYPEALRGVEVQGKVVRVSPTINPDSGTFKVTVAVDSGRFPQVKPGMFATLRIQTATRAGALLVPRQGVLGEENERYLYVVEGDRAQRKAVMLGVVQGEQVEILRGVDAGERVVIVGQYGLKPGNRVRVLEETDGKPPVERP
jgi:membrane fusion protein (multidrug efflux system)